MSTFYLQEDDFEGFSQDEIKASERKLAKAIAKEKKASAVSLQPPKRRPGRPRLNNRAVVQEGSSSVDGLTGRNQDATAGQTPKRVGRPVKGSLASKLAAKTIRPKKFKLDNKQHEGGSHHPAKTKKSDMDMAKFLLEKAKQANIIQEQAKAKRLAAAKNPSQVQKREFVLPKQSSRSSRVIKPNKRFLEEDILSPTLKKKTKAESPAASFSPSVSLKRTSFSANNSEKFTSAGNDPKELFPNQSAGLLDQPLIVAGKRDRKPSLKLQLSDEESLFSPKKSPLISPLAAPKLGTGIFQQSQFQKAPDKLKFGILGSGRKHGASIVQKAKLQLNRAALNKSKAALARALKAEMKREAKFVEHADQKIQAVDSPVSIGGSLCALLFCCDTMVSRLTQASFSIICLNSCH